MRKNESRMCEVVRQARKRRKMRRTHRILKSLLEVAKIMIAAVLITFMGIGLFTCLERISPYTGFSMLIAGGVMLWTAAYVDCLRRRSWYKKNRQNW